MSSERHPTIPPSFGRRFPEGWAGLGHQTSAGANGKSSLFVGVQFLYIFQVQLSVPDGAELREDTLV